MERRIAISALAALCASPALADDKSQTEEAAPIEVGKLSGTLDSKKVTVQFSIAKVFAIAQRENPGQAFTFGVSAVPQRNKHLDVWIKGELANVFDRFQMGVFQENELASGTKVRVTGKLQADGNHFHIDADQLKDFRVMPQARKQDRVKE